MKVKIKQFAVLFMVSLIGLGGFMYSLTAAASEAAGSSIPADAPAWVGIAIGIVAGAAGLVAQIDAQINEEFKRKWPWWVVVGWDVLAGNYKHSKNAGSV